VKPGVGRIIAGVVVLAIGVGITATSKHVVMYGAIIVGLVWIGRGVYTLMRASRD
jgi:hypothetical protein